MRLTTVLIAAGLSMASFVHAQTSSPGANSADDANPNVRHIIGLDATKRNASGTLTVQNGSLVFKTGKSGKNVLVSSIDDVFIGTETTQSGGRTGTVVKTAAIAAPYDSGAALSIMMRTKVDILTISYRDAQGGLHGAIFALPIGRAKLMRDQLIQAGAHAGPIAN